MAATYNMGHRFRGTALIIGNEFKGQEGMERDGCRIDVTMMMDAFRKLDFRVQPFLNLSADKMKEKLYNASQDKNNQFCDCFVLGLSTHGYEIFKKEKSAVGVWRHGVLGEDDKPLFVDDIINLFKNAKELSGKPKLFFLQACRSKLPPEKPSPGQSPPPSPEDFYDQGLTFKITEDRLTEETKKRLNLDGKNLSDTFHTVDLSETEDIYKYWKKDPDEWQPDTGSMHTGVGKSKHDAFRELINEIERSIPQDVLVSDQNALRGLEQEDSTPRADSNQMPTSPFDERQIKCPEDFLIMYPVMSGKYAFRNAFRGSYLIQFLHKGENLRELLFECDILRYLTYVCRDMYFYNYDPDLDDISYINKKREEEAKLEGKYFDRLGTFKYCLYGNIKYLSSKENQDLLVKVIGKGHERSLRGDVAKVETYLRSIIENLSEDQMKSILAEILPFKMAACIVHRLKGKVVFLPKTENTPMGKLKRVLSPPRRT